MKVKIVLFLLFIATLGVNASVINDTIIIKTDDAAEKITRDLDSLVSSWYVKLAIKDNPVHYQNDSVIAEFSDSVYKNRLGNINSIIRLAIYFYHKKLYSCIYKSKAG